MPVWSGPVSTLHALGADDWRQQLHSVVLEGRGLRSLAGLAAAHRLVAANLADNLISDLADLSGCTALQQLNISDNLVLEVRSSLDLPERIAVLWSGDQKASHNCRLRMQKLFLSYACQPHE